VIDQAEAQVANRRGGCLLLAGVGCGTDRDAEIDWDRILAPDTSATVPASDVNRIMSNQRLPIVPLLPTLPKNMVRPEGTLSDAVLNPGLPTFIQRPAGVTLADWGDANRATTRAQKNALALLRYRLLLRDLLQRAVEASAGQVLARECKCKQSRIILSQRGVRAMLDFYSGAAFGERARST
jgi:hypothetical protein